MGFVMPRYEKAASNEELANVKVSTNLSEFLLLIEKDARLLKTD
jgi:hypothetical protein